MAVRREGRSVRGTQLVGYGASAGSGEQNSSTSVRRLRDTARTVAGRLRGQPLADAQAAAQTIDVGHRDAGAGERRDRHRTDRSGEPDALLKGEMAGLLMPALRCDHLVNTLNAGQGLEPEHPRA
jgi:hypothetical protein